MWRLFYAPIFLIPGRKNRVRYWKLLKMIGIADRLSDEAYCHIYTFAYTRERALLPGKGGGIHSTINWQRLHWRSDLPITCSDKIAVRSYVRDKIGDKYLIPVFPREGASWKDAGAINFDELPDKFVLKLNNGSSKNLIVRDRTSLDEVSARRTLQSWLSASMVNAWREHQYEHIESRVYCEMLLEPAEGGSPKDYKIMCSNGKPLYCWVDADRYGNHQRTFFDPSFNKVNAWNSFYSLIQKEVRRPENWDEMVKIACKLSEGIPIVRIDLYNVNGRIYFGEMTFTSSACTEQMEPASFSVEMAAKIDLSPFVAKQGHR